MSNISDLREKIEKYAAYRDISVEVKEESKLMKIIAKILFFNPKFMTDYITTIGSTVYFPREDISNDVTVWEVLPHEMIHADDSRRLGPLFGFLYLFPQILAILSLLAFGALGGNLNWLYWLLFLPCVAPIPAYWRMKYEMRAYGMTMAIKYWMNCEGTENKMKPPSYIVKQFLGQWYYWMFPFRGYVEKELAWWLDQIERDTLRNHLPFVDDIHQMVKDSKDQ